MSAASFVSTSCSIETPTPLRQLLVGACALALFISPTATSKTVVASQTQNVGSTIVSPGFYDYSAYNSGDISLYIEGETNMNADLFKNLNRITEISELEENWNENGASRFSDSIITAMRDIVEGLDVQPCIFPTANHSIQFEYENDLLDYLEFELFEDLHIKQFSYDHNGISQTSIVLKEKINEIVKEFYGLNI